MSLTVRFATHEGSGLVTWPEISFSLTEATFTLLGASKTGAAPASAANHASAIADAAAALKPLPDMGVSLGAIRARR
jgi:hypothetical protein